MLYKVDSYKKIIFAKPEKFGTWELVRGVPVFSTKAFFEGKKVTLDTLKKIIKRMDEFGPCSVIIGHTGPDNNYDEKEVVGIGKNFRIKRGEDGHYYIFCDMMLRDSDLLNKYPRRSVELWDDYTMDPIALLGSSTPKVDLPTVIKFKRFPRRTSDMTHDEINDIADAVLEKLQSTAQWKFLSNLLDEWNDFQSEQSGDEDQGGGDQEKFAEGGEPSPTNTLFSDSESDKDPFQTEEGDEGEFIHLGDSDEVSDDTGDSEDTEALDTGEGTDEGDVDEGDVDEGRDKKSRQGYSRVVWEEPLLVNNYENNQEHSLRSKLYKLQKEHEQLKQMYKREKRLGILKRLQSEGYMLDIKEELDNTANLSDSEFVNYVNRVRKYYRRAPTAPLNAKFLGGSPVVTQELRDAAIEYAYNHGISFEEALKRVSVGE